MINTEITKRNHYVAQVYLKNWTYTDNKLWMYRILVSHPKVPIWKDRTISGIAYNLHFYTRIISSGETDEIEDWLGREFENPVAEPLNKAITDKLLNSDDWKCLTRFLAAQYVRTPARFIENLDRWKRSLPQTMENSLKKTIAALEYSKQTGKRTPQRKAEDNDLIPFRVTKTTIPGKEIGELIVETIPGQGLWLFSIKHVLTKTLDVLNDYSWTILRFPDNIEIFTSDDPVICLNYYHKFNYDFSGGWKWPGTEILLPLDPHHLMYTKVGDRIPQSGKVITRKLRKRFRGIVAEHALREIYSKTPDTEIIYLRHRIVNAERLQKEMEQWRNWHKEQSIAERNLRGWK